MTDNIKLIYHTALLTHLLNCWNYLQLCNLTTKEMGTALLGILGMFVLAYIMHFLLSLVGRATNTTFITRGGSKIQPYKTPTERRDERRTDEYTQAMRLKIINLNTFCLEFGETRYKDYSHIPPALRETFYTIDNPFTVLDQPSATSQTILSLGNVDIALKHYQDLQSLKESGIIDKEEYKRRGVMLLKKMTGET